MLVTSLLDTHFLDWPQHNHVSIFSTSFKIIHFSYKKRNSYYNTSIKYTLMLQEKVEGIRGPDRHSWLRNLTDWFGLTFIELVRNEQFTELRLPCWLRKFAMDKSQGDTRSQLFIHKRTREDNSKIQWSHIRLFGFQNRNAKMLRQSKYTYYSSKANHGNFIIASSFTNDWSASTIDLEMCTSIKWIDKNCKFIVLYTFTLEQSNWNVNDKNIPDYKFKNYAGLKSKTGSVLLFCSKTGICKFMITQKWNTFCQLKPNFTKWLHKKHLRKNTCSSDLQ